MVRSGKENASVLFNNRMSHLFTSLFFASASVLLMASCGEKPKAVPESGGKLGDKVPLKLEYPPENLCFTPKPLPRWPVLVRKSNTAPVFLVPQGSKLLSQGKKVTSSDPSPIFGSLKQITDGERNNSEGYYVELKEGTQWVQIDLVESAALYAIAVWHYEDNNIAYRAVIIQISDDPQFQAGVVTVYNNDYDNTSQLGKGFDPPYQESRFGMIADAKGTKGRYVRIYSSGNSYYDFNRYLEVAVFGMTQEMQTRQ
jgi:hypothetical protein